MHVSRFSPASSPSSDDAVQVLAGLVVVFQGVLKHPEMAVFVKICTCDALGFRLQSYSPGFDDVQYTRV